MTFPEALLCGLVLVGFAILAAGAVWLAFIKHKTEVRVER